MRIDFLEAADGTALTKKYRKTNAGVETESYPFVKYFNSYSESVDSIEEFFEALKHHAAKGRCLLKGTTSRELKNERRVGTTYAAEHTQYLVIDNDFTDGFDSVDDYLATLGEEFADVDYIFHHSSSAGTKSPAGIRGHIIVLLDAPQSPSVIKQWLINRNLEIPALRERITLSANAMAPKWPLDVSTCQNDKLIYIADPACEGFSDPLAGNRFELHKRAHRAVTFAPTVHPATNQKKRDEIVAELREKLGLKKRTPKYTTVKGTQLLRNPDVAIVTGVQDCGEYIRLNLNDGTRWSYWHHKEDPEILFNFKDEPPVRLADIVPDYYRSLTKNEPEAEKQGPVRHIVFRDLVTDTYYNGTYVAKEDRFEAFAAGSVQKLHHFLMQHGHEAPEYIEDWDYVFDPTTTKTFDPSKRWANKFIASPYLRDKDTPSPDQPPTTIDRILSSVCVDTPTKKHFLNWLAYIFQTRKKTGTAWLFHGTQGTGKGILFEYILQPLLGHQYVYEYNTQNIEEQFNAALEQTIIMWIDEFRVEDSKNGRMVINKLKNLITENQAMIRGMRKNAVKRKLYNNIIIATNDNDSIPIDTADRRLNVAPAQETRLTISAEEIDSIEAELPAFAAYLRDFKVNHSQVRTVLTNTAREELIKATTTTIAKFFDAIREGDLDYFLQFVCETPPLAIGNSYIGFEKAVKYWAANRGKEIVVSNTDLLAVYNYLQNTSATPSKFGRMFRMYRLDLKPIRQDGKVIRGIHVTFTGGNDEEISALTDNVVPIKTAT